MNTHMKAAVYERYGPPEVLEIRDVPIPQPDASDVLVQIHATTVSSGDWRARSLAMPRGFGSLGRLVFGIRRPRQPILGTEFSGRIAAVGGNVTRFKVGDDVFGFTGAAMGSHAEYRCMDENDFIEGKPTNLTHDEAAALAFGGMTVLRHFRRAHGKSFPESFVLEPRTCLCCGISRRAVPIEPSSIVASRSSRSLKHTAMSIRDAREKRRRAGHSSATDRRARATPIAAARHGSSTVTRAVTRLT
jgi:hypothetical protein